MITQRWCIYIDILGFSRMWESEHMAVLSSLRELMRAIFRIGNAVYPNPGERLFAHQTGDGFAILSDFGDPTLERPIAIATALLRCVASTGMFASAAIAEGEHADITGLYPREVTDSSEDGRVRLGSGVMTLTAVMGTAFIRAYRLHAEAPSGPFLTLFESQRDRVPHLFPIRTFTSVKRTQLLSVDWIRPETKLVEELQAKAGVASPKPDEIVQAVETYCNQHGQVRRKWARHLRELLEIEV